jgi:hypothetical protein
MASGKELLKKEGGKGGNRWLVFETDHWSSLPDGNKW